MEKSGCQQLIERMRTGWKGSTGWECSESHAECNMVDPSKMKIYQPALGNQCGYKGSGALTLYKEGTSSMSNSCTEALCWSGSYPEVMAELALSNSTLVDFLSQTSASATGGDNYALRYEEIVNSLFKFLAPVLIFGGTMGNLLTLAVMQTKGFKKSPTSIILSCLALADTMVLYSGLLRHWIRVIRVNRADIRTLTTFSCKLNVFFTYLSNQLAPSYLLTMTIERVISVFLPLKCREICTRKRMAIAVAAQTTIIILINIHFLFTHSLVVRVAESGLQGIQCRSKDYDAFYTGPWFWIDSTMTTIIPCIGIFTGNLLIILKLTTAQSKRTNEMQAKNPKSNSTTITLLTVSFCFLLLTLPSSIYFIGLEQELWIVRTMQDYVGVIMSYAVVNLMFYLNNAINFILYCLSGSKFRQGLYVLFNPKLSSQLQRQNSAYKASNASEQ